MREVKCPRRRWYQFSLRSFIVLTTLLAIAASGYYKWSVRPVQGCVATGNPDQDYVWIAPPTDEEFAMLFLQRNPQFASQRNDMSFIKVKLADHLEAGRYIPSVGKTQLHRVEYEASVYLRSKRAVVGTVHIDFDHYHTPDGAGRWEYRIDEFRTEGEAAR